MAEIVTPEGAVVRLLGVGDTSNGNNEEEKKKAWVVPWAFISTVSGTISAYHGYKRNESVGWALWWFLMGSMFPIITPTIALAQGFGKPARR